jgi:hypothetical protein
MQQTRLPEGTLAFTLCGTLVVYTVGPGTAVSVTVIHRESGASSSTIGTLSVEMSAEVFDRTGAVERIDVAVGRGLLLSENGSD